jgi:putative oxidoreductase
MNILLWVLQILLGIQFLWHGFIMVAPPAELVEMMDENMATGFRWFLGTAEILAGVGLIAPSAVRVLPMLTPLAAVGCMIITGSATVWHLMRDETGNAVYTAFLFLLLALVAYGRWKSKPIPSRQSYESAG